MKKIKAFLSVVAIAVALSSALAVTMTRGGPAPSMFSYTAKWICLPIDQFTPPLGATGLGLVPGEYLTDINVHNPSFSTTTLNVTKDFIISIPEFDLETGVVARQINTSSVFASTLLGPDAAMRIDCTEILHLFHAGPGLKGFVRLTTTTDKLYVVAEYAARALNSTASCGINLCPTTGI